MAEVAWILAAFGTAAEVVARTALGSGGPKGREGAPMSEMIPTPTNGT